jgi:hypothetical protein
MVFLFGRMNHLEWSMVEFNQFTYEIFYGLFVVLGSIEKYSVVLRSIKHFDIPTIWKIN